MRKNSRRRFCCQVAALAAAPLFPLPLFSAETVFALPMGSAPAPLELPWFPSRLHAFIWRNWSLVPVGRMASVLGAAPEDVLRVGRSMGLEPLPGLSGAQLRRASLTIIKRNWHLLPYDQLLALLEWTPGEMAFTLREDDFFFHKLGLLKPRVDPLRWVEPDEAHRKREAEIAGVVRQTSGGRSLEPTDPLFSFVEKLSQIPEPSSNAPRPAGDGRALRLGYSFFALYGDPLMDPMLDPYPDGYLARLAASGVNAVWLQGVLSRLSPLPWAVDPDIERRRAALRELVARASRHGIRVFVYLNEPRSLPTDSPVFEKNAGWRGVSEAGFNAVCTSANPVRAGLREGVADLCRAVPQLGGFFTITASENLTSCWSHGRGGQCPRCGRRGPAEVIAEVNAAVFEGIQAAKGRHRLIAWDWGWADGWALEAIDRLPAGVELMSVSEWSLPIERGGVKSEVGEYCLSAVGPGPRAQRHWAAARKRGLPVVAKMQIGTTWEIAAVPYLPVIENVCRHVAALRELGVEALMLGWTLGGHPSPNLDAVGEIMAGGTIETLARRRHGAAQAPAVVTFWRECSAAFSGFPFNGGTVYLAPLQVGPANPLWPKPTGYHASMVGFPYDDLEQWRSVYPAEVFARQLETVSLGMEAAVEKLRRGVPKPAPALAEELNYAEVAAIHFASVANQSRFVLARRAGDIDPMRRVIQAEIVLARRLHALQSGDSRIGFEASNQYFYVPLDLVEKVVNCRWLMDQAAGK